MAMIRNNQKDIFKSILTENGVYSISNIKLIPGPKLYRSVDRDLAINFFYKTKIEKKPDTCVIPRYKFELKSFDDVNSLVNDVRSLIGKRCYIHALHTDYLFLFIHMIMCIIRCHWHGQQLWTAREKIKWCGQSRCRHQQRQASIFYSSFITQYTKN